MSAPQRPGQPWPGQYRPGETEWIPRAQDAPPPEEPLRFQPEPPPRPANPATTWALRIAGLVAIAVVSGLVWWYVNADGDTRGTQAGGESPAPKVEGRYQFTAHEEVPRPRSDSQCAKHAYGGTQEFLARPDVCRKVTQTLHRAEVEGRKALVGVAVVELASPEIAQELGKLTESDGTGNVNDLVREGVVKIPGQKNLSNGYASLVRGNMLVIAECDFVPEGSKADNPLLKGVCEDALRLGVELIESGSGG